MWILIFGFNNSRSRYNHPSYIFSLYMREREKERVEKRGRGGEEREILYGHMSHGQ